MTETSQLHTKELFNDICWIIFYKSQHDYVILTTWFAENTLP